MNVATNLELAAFHFPDHIAVIEGDRSISFSEFNLDVNQIASALVSVGVQPGDHVALCAPNSYAWLVFYFGTLKAGAVAVTFSEDGSHRYLDTNQIVHLLDNEELTVFIIYK